MSFSRKSNKFNAYAYLVMIFKFRFRIYFIF